MKRDVAKPSETCDDDRLLTRSEVDERFGIPKRFLELSASRENGPRFVRVGRLVRYRTCDIREWIAANLSEGFTHDR